MSNQVPAALVLSLTLLAACAAPPRAPLEPAQLAQAVGARGTDPALLEAALEAARLEPLAVPRPPDSLALEELDADGPELWHASAFAFEARTRAARHALLAARAGARSAGAPMPAQAMLEVEELERPDARARLVLTFDLLGILGLGPAAAARELAREEVRRAHAELERAVWGARIAVDRARARLASVRAQALDLEELALQAAAARRRVEILERTGRLAPQGLAAAGMAEERLALRRALLAGEEAEARSALAVAAGVAPQTAWLDELSPATLERWSLPEGGAPTRAELLARSPDLRLGLVDYALAEARLRRTALSRWPTLELGPHLLWSVDELLVGLAAGTSIPWPGSVEGELAAALEQREAARSALEDALLATEAEARAALERLEAARRGWLEHAAPLDAQSAVAWRAVQARFGLEPMALMDWATALTMRADASSEVHGARLAAIEAALDLERARGPAPPGAGEHLALQEAAR